MEPASHAYTARLADSMAHDIRNAVNVLSLGLYGVDDAELRRDLEASLAQLADAIEGIITTARAELGRLSEPLARAEIVRRMAVVAPDAETRSGSGETVIRGRVSDGADLRAVHALLAALTLAPMRVDEASQTIEVRLPKA